MVKRLADIAGALAVLLVSGPLWLAIAGLIKLHDGGPVLYKGRRIGRNGIPFGMAKFRTMVVNADRVGGPSAASDDPRITPIGRWLRKYKLDELPQFINVDRKSVV